ncbi:MAG: division/cell wall cluster transcriptional repressor MraZ [Treponema sp.]|nr:division/cell wall cluster transcriptional repressor MraZ [Treponema sp.]
MDFLTGEFNNTLDDKGRVSIPSRLREKLQENILILTKGIDDYVWLLPPEKWEKVSSTLIKNTSLSLKKASQVQHHFIVPAQEAELDKSGRVAIPQSLREYAGLTRDCVILGSGESLEIWDTRRYQAYQDSSEDTLMDVLEEMGPVDLFL